MHGDDYRIGKFLAHAGVCSRRDAADFLNHHEVFFEGGQIKDLNFRISPNAFLVIDSKQVSLNKSQIILLNKPIGYVCTHKEQKNQKSIFRLLPPEMSRYFYGGRLDEDSRGLVILSNDGDLIFKITHPSNEETKVYHVHTSRPLSDAELTKIQQGVWSKKEKLQVDSIKPMVKSANYEIELHEGKNREIRRIFEAIHINVMDLFRIRIGKFVVEDIAEGSHKIILPGIAKPSPQ